MRLITSTSGSAQLQDRIRTPTYRSISAPPSSSRHLDPVCFAYAPLQQIASWLTTRVEASASFAKPVPQKLQAALLSLPMKTDVISFVDAVAPHASDPKIARERARTLPSLPVPFRPRLDLDGGIEAGEKLFAARKDTKHDKARMPYTSWPLAAAYHHRGCVAWAGGDHDRAERDVARAIELDPHARYFTTAALFAERKGDVAVAADLHDRAVDAIQPAPRVIEHGIVVLEHDCDPPERAAFDAARTLHARGAFFAKQGRIAQAVADLEASIARFRTDAAERALDLIRRRL